MFSLHGYGFLILKGAWETIIVGLSSMAVAIIWGLTLTGLQTINWWPLRLSIHGYIMLMRAVPELVMVLILYYGFPNLIQETLGTFGYDINVNLPSFWAALMALGGIYGAFSAEVFRASFAQVPKGCFEASYSLGLSPLATFWHITLPLATARAVSGLSNVWMTLIKATAVISAIQLPELLYNTELAVRTTHLPFVFYCTACLIYLGITIFSVMIQFFWERKTVGRF